MKIANWFVAVLFLINLDVGIQLHAIRLRSQSFANFALGQSPNTPQADSQEIRKLKVMFTLSSTNGLLLYYRGIGNSWIAVGMQNGALMFSLGKKNEATVTLPVAQHLEVSEEFHVLKFQRNGSKLRLEMDDLQPINYKVPRQFLSAFITTTVSAMLLGLSQNSTNELMYSQTLSSCVYRLSINERYILSPEDALETRDIEPCQASSPIQCGNPYCGNGGICYKTLDCNDHITVEKVNGKRAEESQQEIEVGRLFKSVEFEFGQKLFIHSIRLTSLQRETGESCDTIDYEVQIKGDQSYHNYSERQETAISTSSRTLFLHWPVPTTAIRVKISGIESQNCRLQANFTGCSVTSSIKQSYLNMVPYNDWLPVIQTFYSTLNTTWLNYGPVNDWVDFENPKQRNDNIFKHRLLDSFEVLQDRNLSIKLEVISGAKKTIWVLNLAECDQSITKMYLLEKIQQQLKTLKDSGMGNTVEDVGCNWKLVTGQTSAVNNSDPYVRLSVRRLLESTDVFRYFPKTELAFEQYKRPISLNSSSECATLCLQKRSPKCTGFDVTKYPENSGSNRFGCRLITAPSSTIDLGYNLNYDTYIVAEQFQSYLPVQKTSYSLQLKDWVDPGYQCECVNQMIGARCDNDSSHDNTYHVILNRHTEELELHCTMKNSSLIRIQFASLVSKMGEGPTSDLYDVTSRSSALIRAVCDGKPSCKLSVTRLLSLLPPTNLSDVEIRFVCESSASYNFTLPDMNSFEGHTIHESASTPSTPLQETSTKHVLSTTIQNNAHNTTERSLSSSDVKVYEKQNSVDGEDGLLLLDLFQSEDVGTMIEPTKAPIRLQALLHLGEPNTTTATLAETLAVTTQNIVTTAETTAILHTNEAISPTSNTITCSSVTVDGVKFYESSPGIISTNCPPGTMGRVTLECQQGGQWSHDVPDMSQCISDRIYEISRSLEHLEPGSNITASSIAEEQAEFLQSSNSISSPDLLENLLVVKRLSEIKTSTNVTSNSTKESKMLLKSVQTTVNTLLGEKLIDVWNEIPENERASNAYDVTEAVDDMGFKIGKQIDTGESVTNYFENTAFQVMSLGGKNPQSQKLNSVNRVQFPSSSQKSNDTNWIDDSGSIAVPYSPNAANDTTVVFAVYKNLDTLLGNSFEGNVQTLDKDKDSRGNVSLLNNTSTSEDRYLVNSYVISASVQPAPVELLKTQKVKFLLKHKNTSVHCTMRCVFWKPKLAVVGNSSAGHWSTEGCKRIRSNNTHTECECDHLTNFAILMDVRGVQLDKINNEVLTYITWIGCSMSIVCLVMCVFCFNTLRGLRSIRTSIHKNLCFTLGLAQTAFLLGADKTSYPLLCPIIAGVLHYLFLTVFAWMCIEGMHLYVSLVKVFEIDKSSRLACYYAFAYGSPILVVAITAAIRYDGYGTTQSCWLHAKDDLMIWSFVGPALCVICVNIYFFFIAMRVMRSHRITTPAHRSRLAKTKTWIKGSSVLLCLLGITWIFGVFFVDSKSVVMAYLFTTCNALQGVFIFIFHCLLNERVRTELAKYARRRNLCPSWVRGRYHVTNSVTRSNYNTTTSMGYRSRKSSSGNTENSSQTNGSWSWFKSKETQNDSVIKRSVVRTITPKWKSDSKRVAGELQFTTELKKSSSSENKITSTTTERTESVVEVQKHEPIQHNENVVALKNKLTPMLNRKVVVTVSDESTSCSDGADVDFGCLNAAFEGEATVTPLPERKERIERFYRDYAEHFSGQGNKAESGIFRNNSMPVKVRRDTPQPRAPATENGVSAKSLYFSVGLSLKVKSTTEKVADL
nr:uncharacterized protein LOC100181704 [Ciona intestinalis]|eukprot:XP_018668293.1 uncharacterized protein LOC100181704 [Ciona intestinalis]